MTSVKCPITGCTYKTEEVGEGLAVELMKLHAAVHSAPHPCITRTKKPDRPGIDTGCSESEWAFFNREWNIYTKRSCITGDELKHELNAACTTELRRCLLNFVGESELDKCTHEKLLCYIKEIAVESKNISVHRQEFYGMEQSRDEPIRLFMGRLQSKASHCDFKIKCTCQTDLSYAESMVSDQLVVGLYDKETQGEVLAKHSTLTTLKLKFEYLSAIEQGQQAKRSLNTSTIGITKSQYKRNEMKSKHHNKNQTQETLPRGCTGCGSKDHGPGTRKPRNLHCPNWGVTCSKCLKRNHSHVVCFAKGPTAVAATHSDDAHTSSTEVDGSSMGMLSSSLFGIDFSSLCPLKANCNWSTALPHMEWSAENNKFVPKSPKKPSKIRLCLTPLPEAHAQVGCKMSSKRCRHIKTTKIDFLADTGAQTCACDLDTLKDIGLHTDDLLPTNHSLLGATSDRLDILGAALVELKYGSQKTKVMIYVCGNVTGAYLSESAQIQLGIIEENFPHQSQMAPMYTEDTTSKLAACGCLKRTDTPPIPTCIPDSLKNAPPHELEAWILTYYASSAFNVCDHQPLPKMSGEPLQVHYKPDAQPSAHHTPIPVPHHWKEDVKQQLDADVRLGTIERVPQGTPTIWCSRMIVVSKHDGRPRRTVDLQSLNAATYRETHHTPSPFTQASMVPPHTIKTTLDAWNGYHALPLSPSARDATTFITEWGRYRYLRAPQGFHAAGDAYTRAYDDITINFPRKSKVVDDTVLWDDCIESAFHHTIKYIDLCSRNGIVFNPKKFRFGRTEVEFAGLLLTENGISPSPKMTEAITNFPIPKSITDARSWFGLVNQVAFSTAIAPLMEPLRDLLKSDRFYWDEALSAAFEESRQQILQRIKHGVHTFEVGKSTCLSTDWSKEGVGFILQQKSCTCNMELAPLCCNDGWQLVLAGSRFTTPAESRYAPVEGEALAVTYALEKCRQYIMGCPDLTIVVDHAPLVKLLGDRSLHDISNPRLLRLKEKTLLYNYTIKHIPGVNNKGPDALSRKPVSLIPDNDNTIEETVVSSVTSQLTHIDLNAPLAVSWERIEEATQNDNDLVSLANYIIQGFAVTKQSLPEKLQSFWASVLTFIVSEIVYVMVRELYNNHSEQKSCSIYIATEPSFQRYS